MFVNIVIKNSVVDKHYYVTKRNIVNKKKI